MFDKWEWRVSQVSRDKNAESMLSGGFTGQLLGMFMKATKVCGCCICVRCVFLEWNEMQSSRVVMCQGVGEHQDVNAT